MSLAKDSPISNPVLCSGEKRRHCRIFAYSRICFPKTLFSDSTFTVGRTVNISDPEFHFQVLLSQK